MNAAFAFPVFVSVYSVVCRIVALGSCSAFDKDHRLMEPVSDQQSFPTGHLDPGI